MRESKKYIVPTLARAISILRYLAKKENVGFNTIVKELNLSKSTAYNIINTLLQEGFIQGDAKLGYSLGVSLFSLGTKSISQLEIYNKSSALIQELSLKLGHTCHLGILDKDNAIYIADVKSGPIYSPSWTGSHFTLQTTAMGKAILAWRDEAEVKELLRKTPPKFFTGRAILDINSFMEHLQIVKKYGFSYNNFEADDESFCLGAPIFSGQDFSLGAISVSIPREELTKPLFRTVSKNVHAVSARISKILGSDFYPPFNSMPFPD